MVDLLGLGKRHPQDKDELEGVVEGEPVDSVDSRLNDGQESVDNPVLESGIAMSVICSLVESFFLCLEIDIRSTIGCRRPWWWRRGHRASRRPG